MVSQPHPLAEALFFINFVRRRTPGGCSQKPFALREPRHTPRLRRVRHGLRALAALLCGALLCACASLGSPSGGARDEDPPRLLGASMPGLGTGHPRLELIFDELVNVRDAFSKVTVSPTGTSTPRVSSQGRKVIIQFADSLKPNTTYTVDFGNAVEDINESNRIPSFSYSFTTGEVADSLCIAGMVLGARDLEPQQGMLVGIHSNPADTAFMRQRLERVTRTDDRGRFILRGLAPGRYRLFAVNDVNNDLRWDNRDEDLAFLDTLISPSFTTETVTDTVRNLLTGAVDTTYARLRTRFLPDNILLNAFNENFKTQYLVNYSRPDSARIQLIFNAPAAQLPDIAVAGAPSLRDWYAVEHSRTNDTVTCWLRPRSLVKADTLRLAVSYLRSDSAQRLVPGTDTLRFISPRTKPVAKKKKKEEADTAPAPLPRLQLKMLSPSAHDINRPILLEFGTPVDTVCAAGFRLETKSDTLWLPAKAAMSISRADTLSPRRYRVDYPWQYGTEYRLTVDSLATTDIYGLSPGTSEHLFRTKAADEYSSLEMTVTGYPDSIPAFVELLDSSDKPVAVAIVDDGKARFTFLTPGAYYARLIEDRNGNGKYDTGDFAAGLQPELTYYYPKKINLKRNWDVKFAWNVSELPVDRQKPLTLLKNKPETDRRSRVKKEETVEEEEDYFDPNKNPFDPNYRRKKR